MTRPLDYQSLSSATLPNVPGGASCGAALFLVVWYVWGGIRLVDAFYSGPGGAPYGPDHHPWWYVIYGTGSIIAGIGVVLGVAGLGQRHRGKSLAVIGVVLNVFALFVYLRAFPYPN